MRCLMNITKKIIKDEDGAVLAEYALVLALVSIACVGALGALATAINARLNAVAAEISP